MLIAQCSASASRSTRVTVVAPAFAALRPATPSPEPSSQTRSPRTSSGERAISAARFAAAGQTLAHEVSASMLPRDFSHCQSTSASGGLTTAISGKKPPGTCTSGGSDAEPAWISIVLSGSDAVTASWAAPALAEAEHMGRGCVAHVRDVSGRRLLVNVRDVSGRKLLVNAPTRTRQTAVAITERIGHAIAHDGIRQQNAKGAKRGPWAVGKDSLTRQSRRGTHGS